MSSGNGGGVAITMAMTVASSHNPGDKRYASFYRLVLPLFCSLLFCSVLFSPLLSSASKGGILLSEEDRKKRDRRHRLAVLNVCSTLLAALKSMPPLPEGGRTEGGNGSPIRHNIDLPWVTLARWVRVKQWCLLAFVCTVLRRQCDTVVRMWPYVIVLLPLTYFPASCVSTRSSYSLLRGVVRNVLLELLSSDDTMARRAAAEGLAQMGLKVGDGYAVYLIQVR